MKESKELRHIKVGCFGKCQSGLERRRHLVLDYSSFRVTL
jgi:hypothetical protein